MQLQQKLEDSEFAPSFNCYSSDSITSTAVATVICEEQVARFHETGDVGDVNFEFTFELTDEEEAVPVKLEIDSPGWMPFLVNDEVDREIKATDDAIEASSAITVSLRKLFIEKRDESSSCSSSEAGELESVPSGTYCVWKPKADLVISTPKWKKSRSTGSGSGSERWRLRYLLRRSNSEGKEAVVVVTPKKVDSPKVRWNSGEVLKIGSHERFYVERRAESEIGKRKSFLPYRKDLVGLFANVNGMGKMLPF
ncbi:hypothetical protein SSX86_029041 [Deinandra increscens subsp. villosa]|uniref:Uncharacterized protein n=1 Tax=Deinandra increscens subsp. villosa TaxID=3103831 RepID=A0AAP0CE30_9ASTR